MKPAPSSPVFWGILATLVVFTTGVILAMGDVCVSSGDCMPRWTQFVNAPFNEVGDTFAGFAGAMAFIWIIVTVLLQSRELAAQREELSLTRQEFAEQRKATEDMARSLSAQAAIFEDEQQSRKEAQSKQRFEQLLKSLQEGFERAGNAQWHYVTEDGKETNKDLSFFKEKAESTDDYFINLYFFLARRFRELSALREDGSLVPNQPKPDRLQREIGYLRSVFDKLVDIFEYLPESEKERYQRIRISPSFFLFQRILGIQIFSGDETQ